MRRFRPSTYGATDPAAVLSTTARAASTQSEGGEQIDVTEALQIASVARELILPTDPFERKAVLQAKIINYEGMKRRFPIAAVFYDNEIRKMKAKLAATDRQIAKAKAGERSTQTYRYIGWTVGALAGVLLLATSYRMIKGAK